jgi:hypothetical protein
MRRFRTAAALALAGLASIAGGLAVGRPQIDVEGATFSRESGKPAYSFVGE